ncbi:MAG: zeta toxin family protein [Actinobacteria bacterium]|nr:zeta toxin family protein [Actinomycetota bacterium]MCG2803580.1 zeta toxin family protein [Cellulomonas sp.]
MSNLPASSVRGRVHEQLDALCAPGLQLAVGSALDSSVLHTVGGSGRKWTLERARLHARLLEPYRDVSVGGKADGLCALATAGPPAAGKTSAVSKVLGDLTGWRRIDADGFKESLVEGAMATDATRYRRVVSRQLVDGRSVMPMELAGLFHVESVMLARRAVDLCLRNGENVIIEGTLQWSGLVREYSEALVRAGYESLVVVDVVTKLNVALERAIERWWAGRLGGGLGGRFTPTSAITALYDRASGDSRCSENAHDLVEAAARLGMKSTLEVVAPPVPSAALTEHSP